MAHILPMVVASAVVFGGQYALDRTPPMKIESAAIDPEIVQSGTDANLDVHVEVKRDCPGLVFRTLVSEAQGHPTQLYDATTFVVPRHDGDHYFARRPFHVPKGFSRGPAIYRSWIEFRCNPIQTWWPIIVSAPDIPLTIASEP